MTRLMTRPLTRILWGLAAFLSLGVAIFSYRYLPRLGLMAPGIVALNIIVWRSRGKAFKMR